MLFTLKYQICMYMKNNIKILDFIAIFPLFFCMSVSCSKHTIYVKCSLFQNIFLNIYNLEQPIAESTSELWIKYMLVSIFMQKYKKS